MDQRKRLAILLKIRDGLQETLRSAINKDQVSPENRSEVLSRLAKIQREIEFLKRGRSDAEPGDPQGRRFDADDWTEST